MQKNIAILCGFLLMACSKASCEDMKGIEGANRRVNVGGGYGGVKGTFLEPTNFYLGKNAQIVAHKNQPELYMGLSFDYRDKTAVETDAGVTWAHFSSTDTETGDAYPAKVWWAFTTVFANGKKTPYKPVRLSNGKQWRIPKGSLGAFSMACTVAPGGSLKLSITAGSTTVVGIDPIKWPMAGGKIRDDVIAGMKAKRVVAMTQTKGGPHYDGIYLRGVEFSDGQVAKVVRQGTKLTLGPWVGWSSVASKNDKFFPSGRNADNKGKPTGIYVIDLEIPHKRHEVSPGIPADRENLYDAETVNINLLAKPTVISGKKAKRGKRRR